MSEREIFFWFSRGSLKENHLFQTSIVLEHFLSNKEKIHLTLNLGNKPYLPYSSVSLTWKRTAFVKCTRRDCSVVQSRLLLLPNLSRERDSKVVSDDVASGSSQSF